MRGAWRVAALGLAAACLAAVASAAGANDPEVSSTGSLQVRAANGVVVALGTAYRGECVLEGERIDGRIAFWELNGVIPAFRRAGKGVALAPPADQLPRLAHSPTEPFGPEYVLEPTMMASPLDDDCAIRTFDPLGAVTLEQPGPHVFVQYDQSVHFVRVPSDDAPTAQPCAANDPEFPDPTTNIPPPPDIPDDGKVWAVDRFCNTTKIVGLYVQSRARCSSRGDMSRWPRNPYINQYDAGARLGLPIRFGYRGGDAAGPAALLMAMRRSGPRNLPSLTDLYHFTMQHPNFSGRPNLPNEFVARRAVAVLRSRGWRSARHRSLPLNVVRIELRILEALQKGPVVVSTGFGNARWGKTGSGNLIVILGADTRGSFIVQDPAGDYFASHKGGYFRRGGHYGPGSCGHRTLYPHYWMLAFAADRYLIELGRRTP